MCAYNQTFSNSLFAFGMNAMILHDTDFISSVKAVMSEDLMRSGNPFDIIFVIRNPGAISYSFLNCLSLSSVLAKIDALPAYFIFHPLLRIVGYYQLSWQRKLTSVKSFKADVSSVIPSSVL